jgi:hypothetical protein
MTSAPISAALVVLLVGAVVRAEDALVARIKAAPVELGEEAWERRDVRVVERARTVGGLRVALWTERDVRPGGGKAAEQRSVGVFDVAGGKVLLFVPASTSARPRWKTSGGEPELAVGAGVYQVRAGKLVAVPPAERSCPRDGGALRAAEEPPPPDVTRAALAAFREALRSRDERGLRCAIALAGHAGLVGGERKAIPDARAPLAPRPAGEAPALYFTGAGGGLTVVALVDGRLESGEVQLRLSSGWPDPAAWKPEIVALSPVPIGARFYLLVEGASTRGTERRRDVFLVEVPPGIGVAGAVVLSEPLRHGTIDRSFALRDTTGDGVPELTLTPARPGAGEAATWRFDKAKMTWARD